MNRVQKAIVLVTLAVLVWVVLHPPTDGGGITFGTSGSLRQTYPHVNNIELLVRVLVVITVGVGLVLVCAQRRKTPEELEASFEKWWNQRGTR